MEGASNAALENFLGIIDAERAKDYEQKGKLFEAQAESKRVTELPASPR